MNFRRTLSAALAVGILAAGAESVTAKEYINVETTGNSVTIDLTEANANGVIGVLVKDGKSPSVNGDIFGICETDGTELTFLMPDHKDKEVNGEYTLYVGGKKVGNFYYARNNDITGTMGAVSGMSDSELKAALTEGSDDYYAFGAMGCDLEGYKALDTNAEAARIMFAAAVKNASTEAETAAAFNKAVVSVSMNNGGSVAEGLESVNASFSGKKYSEADSELKKWICDYMSENTPILDVADFDEKYNMANILYLINNAKFSDMYNLLTTYEKALGLTGYSSYVSYVNMSSGQADKQTQVNDSLVNAFAASPCKSAATLRTTLDSAVSAALAGGGGGGGSSKGSSSGGSFLVQPVEEAKPVFDDLGSVAWAEAAITALAEKEVVSGDGTGAFNPSDFVTREQFVKMIVSATGTKTSKANGEFEDVDSDAWYAPYVMGAYKEGIVFGVSDTRFGIGEYISRQDMAVIAYRALGGKTLEKTRDFAEFADFDSISDYAAEAITALYEAGIISGKDGNLFDPFGNATRAESAVVIYNLFVR